MFRCRDHLVRVGAIGHVGRFVSVDPVTFGRGSRVICRTQRGLEVGEVLAHSERVAARGESDGSLLRRMSAEDELLWARLCKNRDEAFVACQRFLDEQQFSVALLDVEPLFDGSRLFFYFLGDVPPQLETRLDQLAAAYESEAKLAKFTEAVEHGCGPDCGTESAVGCGTDGCSTCSIAGACRP